jgi:hypothetical protein
MGLSTPERVAEAKAYLDELRNFERRVEERPDTKTAEDAVWNWYLEWSRLLRHSIANRRWLRRLGLSSRKAPRNELPPPSQPETPELPESREIGALPAPLMVPGE